VHDIDGSSQELSQLRILGVSNMDIFLPIALEPWRETKHYEGLHGRERGSFLWVV
jgi:hypothetical protein